MNQGYNFPRLAPGGLPPVRADRARARIHGDAALSEFGPRSLIYHEGNAQGGGEAERGNRGFQFRRAAGWPACSPRGYALQFRVTAHGSVSRGRTHPNACDHALSDDGALLDLYRVETVDSSR